MSAEIEDLTGVKADLVAGSGGVFDVKVEEKLVFSKFEQHRFPEPGEMASLLQD
ncbi:MAG: SelT/SelW/SelH family (seleno)protein [Proteobacteria bacterium]|nr:SelT/SelW/SelH family (seleno)protein [Pseudomonadota bacterium]MDA0927907.1 SelT/SelW/SelH family (seleno)protein [Pseudomonadota bacterium]